MSDPFTIVVIEDHPLMRESVVRAMAEAGATVVGEASTVDEGYRVVGAQRPAVAIVDIELGADSGIELTRRLLRRDEHLGVVMYTGTGDGTTLRDALDCGARGFVSKTSQIPTLHAAVHAVFRGGTYVDADARARIRALDRSSKPRVLTVREREVLDLVSRGFTGDEIAERLSLSPETIKTHVAAAGRKLGASNRTHSVVIALRNGEIGL